MPFDHFPLHGQKVSLEVLQRSNYKSSNWWLTIEIAFTTKTLTEEHMWLLLQTQ